MGSHVERRNSFPVPLMVASENPLFAPPYVVHKNSPFFRLVIFRKAPSCGLSHRVNRSNSFLLFTKQKRGGFRPPMIRY